MTEARKIEYANAKIKEIVEVIKLPREVELMIWSELMVAYERGAIDATRKESKE